MMNIPFEIIVKQQGAMVLRVCRTILLSEADAQDAWAEVFLAALKHWDSLPEDTCIQAWLVRVAQHKAIDIIRRRNRQAISHAELPERAVTNSSERDIWQIVAHLPEKQRLAIAYHYFAGFTHKETAEMIGSTPEAVRRAAVDGLRNLRKYCDNDPRFLHDTRSEL